MLSEAVQKSRLEGLEALRDVLAAEIEAGPRGEKALSQTPALAKQLVEVLEQIEVLSKNRKVSKVDDLARRRQARRAAAPGRGAAARSG